MFNKAILYGDHPNIAQRMLDFDYICGRQPSVEAIISSKKGYRKLFWGNNEILIPVYTNWDNIDNMQSDTLLNVASYRSAGDVTKDAIMSEKFTYIIVVAEGIPENISRDIIALNAKYPSCLVLGPATVGGIVAGHFRIGNTGGTIESMVTAKLFTQGSIGLVSKSGGMVNEMAHIIAKNSNGIHTGIAIGGDRYPYATFADILQQYEKNPDIKIIVLLGEVGNTLENDVADLIKSGHITKPVIAWVTGISAQKIDMKLQFGHAGAMANDIIETAEYKNNYLKNAGAYVPDSFETLGDTIKEVYEKISNKSVDVCNKEYCDLKNDIVMKANNLGNRRHTSFISSISNETGDTLTYNNIDIHNFAQKGSIAHVIGHLWFKKELPDYALSFINTSIILLADHGPAVSGAHNTIVTSRAGKDVISSLIAGLTTIGPRFGGAIDDACTMLMLAKSNGYTVDDIIKLYKDRGLPIPGIGHKIKSAYNPDQRCIILDTLSEQFPNNYYLAFAKELEKVTLEKKATLILNVDGYIAAMILDMLSDIGYTDGEIAEYITYGIGNGLFALSRSIGFIGHHIDQKRFCEGLYRCSHDDILYYDDNNSLV